MQKNNRYDGINGLRTFACIGIVLMHILTNINYQIDGEVTNHIIKQMTNFVFLFMIISSFSMCCGYFEKIKNNEISPETFYSKRVKKILPFFLFLIILDIVIEHNLSSIVEGFADFTLMFGFLQKEISVIGVAWFLGLVFIFYLMFPFFTYLFSDKKRAWITTLVAIFMHLSSIYYFEVGRSNMFYSYVYFCVGGLIFLYKEKIIYFYNKSKFIGLSILIISTILYFLLPTNNEYLITIRILLLSCALLTYAISYNSKVLNNKVTEIIGNVSFEIYLCHMVIFRFVEKIHFSKLFDSNWISYIFTFIVVIIGSLLLAILFKKIYSEIEKRLLKYENTLS